ncbi:MAG: prephenate dehydrogenase [Kineosporiaceae bacterium]
MTTTDPVPAAPAPPAETSGPVLVVGTGLVGTSVGLGLRRHGVEVLLDDASPTALALARDLGAGTPVRERPGAAPVLVLVAVPPDVTGRVVRSHLDGWPDAVVTDVASVKAPVLAAVSATGAADRFVGGHPMAGRERSGPLAARADLFDSRPWVVTATPATSAAARSRVTALARDLGAVVVDMSPDEHDDAVAIVSHLPQLAASLVAARLRTAGERAVGLAGQGLRDVTRIAASDPVLWAQILAANALPVRRALAGLRADLDDLLAALHALAELPPGDEAPGALAVLAGIVRDGNEGQRLIPGKHGGGPVEYAVVGVLVPDRPGEIARLLADVHAVGVNLEDIRIEHSLGRPTGLVEIAVASAVRGSLVTAMAGRGWRIAA